ncbi:hypothetical protein Pcinc_000799 [Petrolisthes cinctipes]|uniref:Ionotropic glutamate receptor C-terminal domain-containing protein n=1 Tax=Petrolisthes cinctipes TaxID=88211 RepID=A0AAE1GNX0_PETCI|nr:hypothetical protein Pcinc_000799 [Petrolisthes cinctipes]
MVVLVKGEGYIIGYNPKMVVGHSTVWTLQTMTQESELDSRIRGTVQLLRPRWRQTVAALLFLWVRQQGGEGGHVAWATACPPYHNAQAYIHPHHHLHTHTYNQERTLQLRHSFGVDRTQEATDTCYKPSLNWHRVRRKGLLLTVGEIFESHWTATTRLKLGSPQPVSSCYRSIFLGSHWLPRMDSGRLLVLTWLLASLVFMTSYSGILTSMLTVPRITIPIDSLADLVAQSDLPWKLEAGTIMSNILADSTKPEYQETLRRMNGTIYGCWPSREDLVEGKFAAICDKTSEKKVMSWDFSTTGQCHLYITSETIYFSQMSMAFRINSSYLAGTDRM